MYKKNCKTTNLLLKKKRTRAQKGKNEEHNKKN